MGRPPRVPVMLPWEQKVTYFLTLSITPRAPMLANVAVWNAVNASLRKLDRWKTECVLLMPDHLHLLVSPMGRDLALSAFLKWFKRSFNERHPHPIWNWQSGGFDRLLRSDESLAEKAAYIRENPVRAGLIRRSQEWPYYRENFQL